MEEELVDYFEDGKEVILNSVFNSRVNVLDIWKGSRNYREEINKAVGGFRLS